MDEDDEFFYFRDGLDKIATALLKDLNSIGVTAIAEDIHQFAPWRHGLPIPSRMLLTVSPRGEEAVTMTLERNEIEACGDRIGEDIHQRIHAVVADFQRLRGERVTSIGDDPPVRLPKPCELCRRAHEERKVPTHFVIPVIYKNGPYDAEGEAGCPLCGALWRRVACRPELVA